MIPESINYIKRYGILLTRLCHSDIEMVRLWRNSPEIANNMAFQEHISPEMQEKWFKSINNDRNFYFVVHLENLPIGLVNLKNVDYTKSEGEGGIFIGVPEAADAFCGLRAVLAIYDYGFEILGLDSIIIHVRRDNIGAIRMNKMIGFLPDEALNEGVLLGFRVKKERFFPVNQTLRQRFSGGVS